MSAGVPVTPVTSVDVNVTAGILRAVRENRISLLVLGWNGLVSSKTRAFGRHIDAVIERTSQMVLVNRMCQPLNTAKRILMILPPFAEREVGFEEVISTAKILAGQAGTSLLMAARKGEVAWQPSLERLPRRLAREFPENNLTVVVSPSERWDPRQATERTVDASYIHSVFRQDRTLLQIEPKGTVEVLRSLLSTHFAFPRRRKP